MKSIPLGKRGLTIFASIFLAFFLAVGTALVLKVHNDHSPWHVGNGWGICGGYGTKYLQEIPTTIYPAVYNYFHIPHNTMGAISTFSEATSVDPEKESTIPDRCTSRPNNIEGTDSTISGISSTPLAYHSEMSKRLAQARKSYSGVIPPGATKAIQILISKYAFWPNYSGHDLYVTNLQVGENYSLTQLHGLVLGYYPKSGWKVVFEYSRADAPYQGYPPTGS